MAPIPSQIGKYELVRRLGQGGMGSVYLARDPDLDRLVAIKVLREQLFDDELLQRFLREARAAANLRHENVITIYDVGQHDHQPYMALEYVDGQTLLEVIRSGAPLPLAEKLSYVEQICAGLHFAHGSGIVHRDIKPANVMIDRRGIVRILDFGIARVEGSGMTRDGAMIGTLNYMSPEQMLGRPVDFRSDIFAVGTLAYELITYNKAFPGSLDEGLLQKLPYEQPSALSTFCEGLPQELEAAVFRALAKRPEDRFADLEQMRLAIRDVRREIDPELALETIVVTTPRGSGGRSSSSGRSEHPEFAERRARQIAVHLEAARSALSRRDIDAALAACEDALTLAPDHDEALALLAETERARQQRDEESRARRERERSVRQRIADADLRLSRGDVEGAVRTLDHALTIDPGSVAGRTLLPRVREAALAAGLALPASLASFVPLPVADRPAEEGAARGAAAAGNSVPPTVVVPGRGVDDAIAAASPLRRGRTHLLVTAAAGVVAVAASVIVWLIFGERPIEPTADSPGTQAAAPSQQVVPEPDPLSAAVSTAPAGPDETPSPAAIEPSGAAAQKPAAIEPSRPAAPDPDAMLRRQIADVTAIYRGGDLAAALGRIEPLLDTSDDPSLRELAATLARAATRAMTTSAQEADVVRSAERAPKTYAAATQLRARAERALEQNRYLEAGRSALVAVDGFRQAEAEAKAAATAAARNQPEPVSTASARAALAADPPAVSPSSASSADSPATERPAVRPANAAASSTSPSAAVPIDEAGIFTLLDKYQEAYREVSVDKLNQIFPRMLREREQALREDFKQFRECQVQFLNPEVRPARNDPSAATVFARTNYTCQPKTRQPPVSYSQDEIFQVRRLGDTWLIQSTGSLDAGAR